MNWDIQDLSETYPIIRESIQTDADMEIAKAILDLRIVIAIDSYNKDLLHPSIGSDAFRVILTGKSSQGLTVDVFCPVSRMSYEVDSIIIPFIPKGSYPSLDMPSYAIVEPSLIEGTSISGLNLMIHEDCLIFIQGVPTLNWGGHAVTELKFKSTDVAPVAYQNDKIVFSGSFSSSIPSANMLDIEKKYSSKGLRSINSMSKIVNFITLNNVEASVSKEEEEENKTTTLSIKPIL